MSTQALAIPEMKTIETVLIQGDLASLKPSERVAYYKLVCESVGLNPYTRPFDYITYNGKVVLYSNKSCSEQLRKIHGISVTKLDIKDVEGLRIVIAYGADKTGRTDAAMGAVAVGSLHGLELANAYMKAETKAKRRLTLSLAGLSLLDESEMDDMPDEGKPRRLVMEDSIPQATVEMAGNAPEPPVKAEEAPSDDSLGAVSIRWATDRQSALLTVKSAVKDEVVRNVERAGFVKILSSAKANMVKELDGWTIKGPLVADLIHILTERGYVCTEVEG